jgi:hypothetical protein
MKKTLIYIIAVIVTLSACEKNETRMMNKARKKLAGTYSITSINTFTYDTAGIQLTKNTVNYAGTLTLTTDKDVYNKLVMPASLLNQSETFHYFADKNLVMDFDGQPGTYWEADPAGHRITLWTTSASESWHLQLTLEEDDDDYTWTYISALEQTSPTAQSMILKEIIKLKKTD